MSVFIPTSNIPLHCPYRFFTGENAVKSEQLLDTGGKEDGQVNSFDTPPDKPISQTEPQTDPKENEKESTGIIILQTLLFGAATFTCIIGNGRRVCKPQLILIYILSLFSCSARFICHSTCSQAR